MCVLHTFTNIYKYHIYRMCRFVGECVCVCGGGGARGTLGTILLNMGIVLFTVNIPEPQEISIVLIWVLNTKPINFKI